MFSIKGANAIFFVVLQSMNDLVLRGFQYCIIDEVDSILIDEARTPLIISGPAEKPSEKYYKAAKIASAFGRDIHYTVIFHSINIMHIVPQFGIMHFIYHQNSLLTYRYTLQHL
jgi:hypothetical protein